MINQYITRSLERKNRGVYFKKGKWILHLICIATTVGSGAVELNGNKPDGLSLKMILPGFLVMLPFLSFFYFYCLYLIPSCFKQNRYRKFWTIMTVLLLVFPLLDLALQEVFARHYPTLAAELSHKPMWKLIGHAYWQFIRNFVGYTAILYFMELMEGIRTSKEIYTNSNELALAERSLIRTRMDPVFMMHSLDGIIRLSEQKSALAPSSVVGFSDILRYRLYRSQEPLVPLPEELDYLEKLFLFTNTLNNDSRCSLEVQGPAGPQQWLPPLSVINIAETLINTRKAEDETWSLLLYLLAEEKELQIAAELQTGLELEESMEDVRKNLELVFGIAVIFAVEKTDNTYSLRICLPLRSNAS